MYRHNDTTESPDECIGQHPGYAILSCFENGSKLSRLFFEAQDLASDFRDIRCLDYTSSLKKPAELELLKKMDQEGGPEQQAWMVGKNLDLPLGDFGGRSSAFEFLQYILAHASGVGKTNIKYRFHGFDIHGSTYSMETSLFRGCVEDRPFQKRFEVLLTQVN